MSNFTSSNSLICKDHLILRPEEASFCDLLRFLFNYNERKELIDCPSECRKNLVKFNYRWLVFVSALLLKLLLFMKTPMEYMGYLIETSMNLVAINGGLLNLFRNFIKGKMVMPNISSETYRSMLAFVDERVDLDPKIKPGHVNYEASLAWMASKLSYENPAFTKNVVENHWKMNLIDTYNFRNDFQGNNSTQAFMLHNMSKDDKDLIVVAFRGTSPFDANDWYADMDISWYGLSKVGRAHGGFMKALGLQSFEGGVGWPKEIEMGKGKPRYAYYTIRQVLKNILKENKNAKFLVVGHSLGGALAILFASVLILHEEKELLDKLEGVYTFGQPRVGDEDFGEFMKKKLKAYNVKYCRYVYCNDMVPRLPYDDKTLMFKHFGPSLYYDSYYNGKEVEEEPNKNYFSLQWMMPKHKNAGWELLRGFILPYMVWGPTYKEGWAGTFFRVIGLFSPGLSAHGPQDYTNLTRLGHLSSFSKDDNNTKLT